MLIAILVIVSLILAIVLFKDSGGDGNTYIDNSKK